MILEVVIVEQIREKSIHVGTGREKYPFVL